MKVAIMQPYFFPYMGYFQLIQSVDTFVVYDNIKYTKKGWINRNRILCNGTEKTISLPLKKASDYLDIVEREISPTWNKDRIKILNVISSSYSKAPFFKQTFDLVENCLLDDETNLFRFLFNTLTKINKHLDINTKVIVSSDIDIDHSLKSQKRVLEICKAQNALTYINAIGGKNIYTKQSFAENDIELNFIQTSAFEYKQFGKEHIQQFSIIDVMMFNSIDIINQHLNTGFCLV